MKSLILGLDRSGLPHAWLSAEEAITCHAKGLVQWSLGAWICEFRGGWQRDGQRSRIRTRSILGLRGVSPSDAYGKIPAVSNALLFARDRSLCAYCGGRFRESDLSCEHVTPVSTGGAHAWTNVVTACRACNSRKADRTPEQARMPLLYVPYTPNRHEHFIMRNRHILADQMEYLLQGVPKTSRLRV